MPSSKRRNPKSFNGTRRTTHHLKEILPSFLQGIEDPGLSGASEVMELWKELMGPSLAAYARAQSFKEGILTVKVLNQTLFALLSKQEKPRLMKRLRESFPKLTIKTIEFRIG